MNVPDWLVAESFQPETGQMIPDPVEPYKFL